MWCSLTFWNKSHQKNSLSCHNHLWFCHSKFLASKMSNDCVGSTCCFCLLLMRKSLPVLCRFMLFLPPPTTSSNPQSHCAPVNHLHPLSHVSKLASVSFRSHIQCQSGRSADWTVALWRPSNPVVQSGGRLQSANRATATWATVHACFLKAGRCPKIATAKQS